MGSLNNALFPFCDFLLGLQKQSTRHRFNILILQMWETQRKKPEDGLMSESNTNYHHVWSFYNQHCSANLPEDTIYRTDAKEGLKYSLNYVIYKSSWDSSSLKDLLHLVLILEYYRCFGLGVTTFHGSQYASRESCCLTLCIQTCSLW